MVASMQDHVPERQCSNASEPKTPINQKQQQSLATFELFQSPNPILSPSTISQGRLSPKIGKRRRKRKIKFNKVVHNRRIPHLNDLSKEEIEATWIQPEDYETIRDRCVATVKKMMRGGLTQQDCESGDHCARGLEAKTKDGSTARREHKLDSITAVLEEQNMQWNEDVDDDIAIMEVYSIYTIPCAQFARELAVKDAEDAKAYLKEKEYHQSVSRISVGTLSAYSKALLNNLGEILHVRKQKTALLSDIESHIFNEAAMERRRSMYDRKSRTGPDIARDLRDYFQKQVVSDQKGGEEHDVPSLASSHCSDSTRGEDSQDERDSFTSQLRYSFHARKRRSVDLESIEKSIYEASTEFHEDDEDLQLSLDDSKNLASAGRGMSFVGEMSRIMESRLANMLGVREKYRTVVDELRSALS